MHSEGVSILITELSTYYNCLKYESDRQLVGVQFVFSKKEYDSSFMPEATHQLFFCMMVKIAASGKMMKIKKEHLYCSAAQSILGFSIPKQEVLSGKIPYERGMYCSPEIAEAVQRETPYLEHHPYGMLIASLEQFEFEPDVVISISKPYTAMRIVQSYAYLYGRPQNLHIVGMGGICTELMAQAYQSQDINLSFLCSNTRFSGNWRDDEVGIAMPYHLFLDVKAAVVQTTNLFESDKKKTEIELRVKRNDQSIVTTLEIKKESNYYHSCLGVAKLGTEGYHKKIT